MDVVDGRRLRIAVGPDSGKRHYVMTLQCLQMLDFSHSSILPSQPYPKLSPFEPDPGAALNLLLSQNASLTHIKATCPR